MQKILVDSKGVYYPVGRYPDSGIDFVQAVFSRIIKMPEFHNKTVHIFCAGSSGVFLAALLCERMLNSGLYYHVSVVVVRKEGEKAHHDYSTPIRKENAAYFIIDDFVGTGDTMRRIFRHFISLTAQTEIDLVAVSRNFSSQATGFSPKILIQRK